MKRFPVSVVKLSSLLLGIYGCITSVPGLLISYSLTRKWKPQKKTWTDLKLLEMDFLNT